MNANPRIRSENLIALLRGLNARPAANESCDFCGTPIGPAHRHLLEPANHKIICACDACALRFQNVANGRFKLIPRDARPLQDLKMTDALWESLALPINLVFIYRDSLSSKITAMYPSVAGATESLLPIESWSALERDNAALAGMESDVEALLINRTGQKRDYFIAPMDVCYELTGLIRMHWRGLSGGDQVWREIDGFFARLQKQEVRHA